MSISSLRASLAAIALGAASLFATAAVAGPFSQLVVFGDSLSDNGNNALAGLFDPTQVVTGNNYVPSAAYASGVYSNGPVWATYFATALGVTLAPSLLPGGTDYAFGGATTGTPGVGPGGFPYSLSTQVSQYLTPGRVAPSDALYVIAGGGNNARAALSAIAGGADLMATTFATAAAFASDIGKMVDSLQAIGAQHIIVWDTPNIGLAPAVASVNATALGSFVAGSMNTALTTRLAGEAGVSIFDIYGLGTALGASPGSYGFTNATDACGAVAGANCAQYVYWDGIHPTTAADRVIANALLVTAVPEPTTWALMIVGLGVVGWGARRRV